MFVSLLNDITTNAVHSIYFTEKTTALTVGSTVTITSDNISEYIHIPNQYLDLNIGGVLYNIMMFFSGKYFLFYSKTGDEYVDEFIKTSGIYNFSLDNISDETIEAFKKCEYGAMTSGFEEYAFITCPIGEFGRQRDSYKKYKFVVAEDSNAATLTVESVETSCTIQELIL